MKRDSSKNQEPLPAFRVGAFYLGELIPANLLKVFATFSSCIFLQNPLIPKAKEIKPRIGFGWIKNDNPLEVLAAHGSIFSKVPEMLSCAARREYVVQFPLLIHSRLPSEYGSIIAIASQDSSMWSSIGSLDF
jgi:hypothetical protein